MIYNTTFISFYRLVEEKLNKIESPSIDLNSIINSGDFYELKKWSRLHS